MGNYLVDFEPERPETRETGIPDRIKEIELTQADISPAVVVETFRNLWAESCDSAERDANRIAIGIGVAAKERVASEVSRLRSLTIPTSETEFATRYFQTQDCRLRVEQIANADSFAYANSNTEGSILKALHSYLAEPLASTYEETFQAKERALILQSIIRAYCNRIAGKAKS